MGWDNPDRFLCYDYSQYTPIRRHPPSSPFAVKQPFNIFLRYVHLLDNTILYSSYSRGSGLQAERERDSNFFFDFQSSSSSLHGTIFQQQ
jgi:hypothetical protein